MWVSASKICWRSDGCYRLAANRLKRLKRAASCTRQPASRFAPATGCGAPAGRAPGLVSPLVGPLEAAGAAVYMRSSASASVTKVRTAGWG